MDNEFCSPSLHICEPLNQSVHSCSSQSPISGHKPPRAIILDPTLVPNPCAPPILVDSSLTGLPFQFWFYSHPWHLTPKFRVLQDSSLIVVDWIYSSPNILILLPMRGVWKPALLNSGVAVGSLGQWKVGKSDPKNMAWHHSFPSVSSMTGKVLGRGYSISLVPAWNVEWRGSCPMLDIGVIK